MRIKKEVRDKVVLPRDLKPGTVFTIIGTSDYYIKIDSYTSKPLLDSTYRNKCGGLSLNINTNNLAVLEDSIVDTVFHDAELVLNKATKN